VKKTSKGRKGEEGRFLGTDTVQKKVEKKDKKQGSNLFQKRGGPMRHIEKRLKKKKCLAKKNRNGKKRGEARTHFAYSEEGNKCEKASKKKIMKKANRCKRIQKYCAT